MRVLPLIALVLLSQPALANPWELITGITYKETETETSLSVEKTIPEELLGRDLSRGESDLRGHITGDEEDEEGSGSIAYVPQDPEEDDQLAFALSLIRGEKTDPAFPPDPAKALPN